MSTPAQLMICNKCGKYFLANANCYSMAEHGANCPHCETTDPFDIWGQGEIEDVKSLVEKDSLLCDDAGYTFSEDELLASYLDQVRLDKDDMRGISFDEWVADLKRGDHLWEVDLDKVRKDVFPYLAEIIETYCGTDQTYYLGRYIDWTDLDNEEVKLLAWHYGAPNDELRKEYLGNYLNLATDYVN